MDCMVGFGGSSDVEEDYLEEDFDLMDDNSECDECDDEEDYEVECASVAESCVNERRRESRRCVAELGGPELSKESKSHHADSSRSLHIAPPQDPKQYIDALTSALTPQNVSGEWKQLYKKQLESFGGHASASPSFFLNTARVLAKHDKAADAVRIATNCLESGIDDVQMLRSVGYVLLSAQTSNALDLSIQLFDKVLELAPCEPQSFIDSGLVRFYKSWRAFASVDLTTLPVDKVGEFTANLSSDISIAQERFVHVLTHHWATRFAEVEWPVLILTHYLAELVEDINKSNLPSTMSAWPSGLDVFKDATLRCPKFDPILMIWLGWDTDKTDVDLHVKEPSGQEIFYSNKRGTSSLLSRDFTQGYGPEVYIAKNDGAMAGDYGVSADYFSSHQDSALTGTTSAVVWTIESDRSNRQKTIKFNFTRLGTQKEKTHLDTISVGPAPARK